MPLADQFSSFRLLTRRIGHRASAPAKNGVQQRGHYRNAGEAVEHQREEVEAQTRGQNKRKQCHRMTDMSVVKGRPTTRPADLLSHLLSGRYLWVLPKGELLQSKPLLYI